MEENKLEEACQAFEASMKAEASGGTLLNLARCHEKRGLTATAWAEYKRAIPMFRDSGEPRREQAARDLAEALEPKLSKLTIEVEQAIAGLAVTRNGEPVAEASFGTAVAIDPGAYRIEASAPGHQSWATSVTIGLDGDQRTVTIPVLQAGSGEVVGVVEDPQPSPDTAEPQGEGTSPLLIAGVVVGSVGVVVAGIGGVMGGLVLSDAGDAENDQTLCPNKVCTPAGRDAIDAAEGKALVANIMIPVGAAAAVGGLVMILIGVGSDAPADDAAAAEPRVRVLPTAGPYGGGLQISAAF